MKLLSVNLARSFWVGQTADLNPKGMAVYPLIITFLVDTYKFKKFPSPTIPPVAPPMGEGFKFQWGEFTVKEGFTVTVGLSLHTDGLLAETNSSTDDTDAFLSDMLARYSEIFQSPDYNEVLRRKIYVSQLYVSSDKTLQIINPRLNEFASLFGQNITPAAAVELGGISFWSESINNTLSESFTFERAINSSLSDNRYYSAAPLQTNKHLELLDKLEEILS